LKLIIDYFFYFALIAADSLIGREAEIKTTNNQLPIFNIRSGYQERLAYEH